MEDDGSPDDYGMTHGTTPILLQTSRGGSGPRSHRDDGARYAPGHNIRSPKVRHLRWRCYMFQRGLLGGTFDRTHEGHVRLIAQALEHCAHLEIWITSDDVAKDER